MRLFSTFSLVALLFVTMSVSACAQSAAEYGAVEARSDDDIAERQAIFNDVAAAVRARDFVRLNAMSEDMRSRRSRTPSGVWRLAYFYYGLEATFVTARGECIPMDPQFYADWAAVDPQQPAAHIALAMVRIRHAWCRRGSGYAHTLSDMEMDDFNRRMAAARTELETHGDVASVDPQYYKTLIDIAATQGLPRAGFEMLVEEAIDRHAYYYGVYFAASPYYLPQWNGRSGDIDRLADWAADSTSTHDGAGTYARVIWNLEQCNCLTPTEVDWRRMEQGMNDIAARFPTNWNIANFARLSCKLDHPDAAARYFGMMQGGDTGRDWSSRSEWQQCRTRARV